MLVNVRNTISHHEEISFRAKMPSHQLVDITRSTNNVENDTRKSQGCQNDSTQDRFRRGITMLGPKSIKMHKTTKMELQ